MTGNVAILSGSGPIRIPAGPAQLIRGTCWYYKPMLMKDGATRVGSLTVGFPGTPSMTSDRIKLCFYSGVLSFQYTHLFGSRERAAPPGRSSKRCLTLLVSDTSGVACASVSV
jgi:hypothetical protein